jgi:hypothetical protein
MLRNLEASTLLTATTVSEEVQTAGASYALTRT